MWCTPFDNNPTWTHPSQFNTILESLENRIDVWFNDRHEYPMWPSHHDDPLDVFEEEFHGPIRHAYYQCTIELIRVLRQLRQLQ